MMTTRCMTTVKLLYLAALAISVTAQQQGTTWGTTIIPSPSSTISMIQTQSAAASVSPATTLIGSPSSTPNYCAADDEPDNSAYYGRVNEVIQKLDTHCIQGNDVVCVTYCIGLARIVTTPQYWNCTGTTYVPITILARSEEILTKCSHHFNNYLTNQKAVKSESDMGMKFNVEQYYGTLAAMIVTPLVIAVVGFIITCYIFKSNSKQMSELCRTVEECKEEIKNMSTIQHTGFIMLRKQNEQPPEPPDIGLESTL